MWRTVLWLPALAACGRIGFSNTASSDAGISPDPGFGALAQRAYLKASNAGPADQFGSSIALSGDTLVVAASLEASAATGVDGDQTDDSANSAGAVYVFVRSGASWVQQAYLKASNTGEEDGFGRSVSLDGDTLAVGASGESSAATGVDGDQASDAAQKSGAVYVFVRTGTTWTQQAYLKASNTDDFDFFGSSVSLSADTLAVGATGESSAASTNQADNSASSSGAVYVFVRTGAVWSHQAYLKASNPDLGAFFGTSVSVSGDTLVVGAPGETSAATGVNGDQLDRSAFKAGAAYVFVRSGTAWSQQAYLKASNTRASGWFGESVSLSGNSVAVGARGEPSLATGVNGDQTDTSASFVGAVYLFVRDAATWTQQAYLKASNSSLDDNFGHVVSLSGNALVVGAYGEDSRATGVDGDQRDNSTSNAGAAYLFTRSASTWTQRAYLKASNPGMSDVFGFCAAVSGTTVVVGASFEDSASTGVDGNQTDESASEAGAIYVFESPPG